MLRLLSFIALLILGGCASVPSAANLSPGDRVLSLWADSQDWWAGTIESVSADGVAVAYDDGTAEVRTPDQVRPLNWRVGTPVRCMGATGRIAAYVPSARALTFQGEDGVKQEITTGACIDGAGAAAS